MNVATLVSGGPSSDAHRSPAVARSLAVTVALAITVAALTWHLFDAGPGWLLTDAVLVVALLAGVGRGRPGGAAWLLGLGSIWSAGATCWHASDWSLAIAFPASVATLVALGLSCARRTTATHLVDVPATLLSAVRELPGGVADAVRQPAHALDARGRAHAVGVMKGLLVGLPLAGLFVLLLAADPSFRHTLGRALGRTGDGLDLAMWTAATTCTLLVGHAVLRRVKPPATPSDAVLPPSGPYRVEGDSLPSSAPVLAARLRPLTWSVVLLQIVVVFAVYVVANASSLFVGHAHLQARGTSTYSAYLHEGFTQVSVATLLAVTCVAVGHLLLRPRIPGAPIAGGRPLAGIELALLGLVGVTLASCGHRLALYEEAYGYTYLRLGVWLLQLGVAGLLAMTGARCVARGWTGWGSAVGWSAVAFAMFAGSLDADGWIARHNVDRARAGAPLDTDYLASLSEDARPVLSSVNALDPAAAGELEATWAARAAGHRRHGWRSWRGLGSR